MAVKAILDVGIIVLAIEKNNPVRSKYLGILEDCIKGRIVSYIPLTVILGAYHVLVKVFKADRNITRNKLLSLMQAKKIRWIPEISSNVTKRAIEYASVYDFESWDGYLLALMRDFDIPVIYTIDEDFQRVNDIEVEGLLNQEEKDKLNAYINALKKKHLS